MEAAIDQSTCNKSFHGNIQFLSDSMLQLYHLMFDGDGVFHPCGLLQGLLILKLLLSLFYLLLFFSLHRGHSMQPDAKHIELGQSIKQTGLMLKEKIHCMKHYL